MVMPTFERLDKLTLNTASSPSVIGSVSVSTEASGELEVSLMVTMASAGAPTS